MTDDQTHAYGHSYAAGYVGGFIDGISDHMHRLYEEVMQRPRPRRRTHAVDRTHSQRRRAGSRRNKRHPTARQTYASDTYGGYDTIGAKPNHGARLHNIQTMFPLAPGASDNLAKRW